MKLLTSLITAASLFSGFAFAEDKSITVKCITGLRYDVTEIKLKVGDTLKLTFSNPDIMQHNLVIVQKGASAKVATAAMALGAAGMEKGFIPESDSIIAHSKLLNKDQKDELVVKFDKPGIYPYICTFPGHYVIMKGNIIVE